LGFATTNVASSAPASSSASASANSNSNLPPPDPVKQQAAKQAVQQDVAQTRADQCKKATTDYNQAVDARRIYKPGANGEREYLSDADADQQRLNLRLAMEAVCGQ
ncbi:MAG TPA: hypothetical protein VGH84_10890, partial [Steroidobacteraceae bacterium]